jgi:hypothetical protein
MAESLEGGAGTTPPPPGAKESLRPSWRALVACLVWLLFAGIALGQLQGLLAGMHLSAEPSSSIGGLNHLFHLGADPQKTKGTIEVWHRYAGAIGRETVPTASPYRVVWWAVLVDSLLFAPLYVASLVVFFLRARRELAFWQRHGLPTSVLSRRLERNELTHEAGLGPYRWIAGVAIGFALAGGAADEVENASNLLLVRHGWTAMPDYGSGWFHGLAWLLWLSGWAKWVLDLMAVMAALVLAWVLIAGKSADLAASWPALRRRLYELRLHVVLALLLAVVLFAHEQIPDLVRRWTPVQLAIDLVLLWIFALALWFIGRRLLTSVPKVGPPWLGRALFVSLLALAAVQAVVHFSVHGAYRSGWGLLVPAGILSVLAVMGRLLPDGVGTPPRPSAAAEGAAGLPQLLASVALVGFGAGVLHASFGYAVYARAWSWWSVALVGAAALGLVPWRARRRGEPLLWAAGASVACLVALWVSDRGELNPSILVAVAGLLLLAGFRLYDVLASTKREGPSGRWLALGVTVVLAACYGVTVAFPWWTGEQLSVIGVLLLFLIVVAAVGGALVWATPALPVPRALRVVHIGRFPVMALLVAWFLVAGLLDKGGYHNVRIENVKAAATPVTLAQAFDCWLVKNGLEPTEPCTTAAAKRVAVAQTSRRAVPLILVATTGGGIRAAYWTDRVLDCAFEIDPKSDCRDGARTHDFARSNRIFAASGISGGSLGLASYAAYLTAKKRSGSQSDWVQQRLDGDALSPSGAWWLMVELPRAFLQFRSPTDRAGVLERGWERQWPGRQLSGGLFALWRNQQAPLLLLNGTSVEDGCRFETSVLNGNVQTADGEVPGCHSSDPFDETVPADPSEPPPLDRTRVAGSSVLPATRDLVDYLCGGNVDVRLSTAALLSARFPFVNPSGRIERRCDLPGSRRPIAYVVDGGYLDTSGASPIVELMTKLGPMIDTWNGNPANSGRCIVPQIDNGFDSAAARPSRRPAELLVPLTASFATRLARAAEGRNGAALVFDQPVAGSPAVNRYARFVNQAHPGPHAPLGWTQSHESERELTGQLQQDLNRRALAEVRNWLKPGVLRCG